MKAIEKEYAEAKTQSKSLNERNDCAVIAVALAANVEYKLAHALMLRLGRRKRRGSFTWITHRALWRLGFALVDVRDQFQAKTVRTLSRECKKKARRLRGRRFLVRVKGHTFVMSGSEVLDWTHSTCRRIQTIYEVISADHPQYDNAREEWLEWSIFDLEATS